MVRGHVCAMDADGVDGIHVLEHLLDLRPAVGAQQNLAAGTHEAQRLVGLARYDGADDVDARLSHRVLAKGSPSVGR